MAFVRLLTGCQSGVAIHMGVAEHIVALMNEQIILSGSRTFSCAGGLIAYTSHMGGTTSVGTIW